VRLAKCPFPGRRPDAEQEAAVAADRTTHGTFHHEAQTAHQLLFNYIAPNGQRIANPLSRLFATCG
jgi:hypothetical protein